MLKCMILVSLISLKKIVQCVGLVSYNGFDDPWESCKRWPVICLFFSEYITQNPLLWRISYETRVGFKKLCFFGFQTMMFANS